MFGIQFHMEEPKVRITKYHTANISGFRISDITYECDHSDNLRNNTLEGSVLTGVDVVAAIVHNPIQDCIFLVRQLRLGSLLAQKHGYTGSVYPCEVVAGVIDQDCTPEQMIYQEIIEETGLTPIQILPLDILFLNPAQSISRVHLFYASVSEGAEYVATGQGRKDESEDISVVSVHCSDVDTLIENGNIIDTLTICSLYRARRFYSLEKSVF